MGLHKPTLGESIVIARIDTLIIVIMVFTKCVAEPTITVIYKSSIWSKCKEVIINFVAYINTWRMFMLKMPSGSYGQHKRPVTIDMVAKGAFG
jgi:hypothetical protein